MVRPGTRSAAQGPSAGRVGQMLLGLLCAAVPVLVADAHGALPAGRASAVTTRFSSLSELTPRNVRGLMPLSVLPVQIGPPDNATAADPAASGRAAQLGSLAAADERLREFVSWRLALDGGGAVTAGSHGNGVAVSLVAAPAAGAGLAAWDAAHSRLVWAAAAGKRAAGRTGALVTAGGLILYCSEDGWFNVLDVATGRELWKHRLSGGERGTPISYLGPDGHQFVAVLTEQHGRGATLQAFSLPH